jgi:GDPmannose 4,6-dehydratase
MKTCIITGITGQDGSYLAELLLEKNYKVIGLYRRSSSNTLNRISHIKNPNFTLEEFDITDPASCNNIIKEHNPLEVYNLAAQSHVGTSFKQPSTTFSSNTLGVINLLESIKLFSAQTKFYQASTSEMFGYNYSANIELDKFQNENTPFGPQSPYGVSKLASHQTINIYRQSYDLFCCSGILFNHESPRRGENFVTRKITKYIAQLINNKIPKSHKLGLGNLDAFRDWGHAKDYVRAMYLMLQQNVPKDYVISTGKSRSVRDFCRIAFETVNLNYENHIYIDPQFYRPSEVDYLKGDSSLANEELGWKPEISFETLVQEMVTNDLKVYK